MRHLYVAKKGSVKYSVKTLKALVKDKTKFWLDVTKPTKDELDELSHVLGIHHLVVEDMLHTTLRPKIEEYKKYLFTVTHGLSHEKTLSSFKIDMVMAKNWVLTSHSKPMKEYEALWRKKEGLEIVFKKGADFVAHKLLDVQLDNDMEVLETITQEIDHLEDRVIGEIDSRAVEHILRLKRELLSARRILLLQRDMVSQVTKHDVLFICDECVLYFRDLFDHLILTIDRIDTQREMLSNIMEVHLSMVSNRMNEVMKVLTIIATIMLPVTAIGSVYGMNFRYMPELYHPYGYFMVLGVMGFIVIGMVLYFRRKKWV